MLVALLTSTLALGAEQAEPADPAEHDYPVTLAVGAGGLAGPGAAVGDAVGEVSAGGAGVGRLLVHWRDFALDAAGGDGLVAADLRTMGLVSFGLRWSPGRPYLRLGFVHLHETPWAVVEADPLLASIGSAEGIRHRSGGELAMGLLAPLLPDEVAGQRLGAFVELSSFLFPDDAGPRGYAVLETGLSWSLGRDRSADP